MLKEFPFSDSGISNLLKDRLQRNILKVSKFENKRREKKRKLNHYIIWQGSVEENPDVLIGFSVLVGIFPSRSVKYCKLPRGVWISLRVLPLSIS